MNFVESAIDARRHFDKPRKHSKNNQSAPTLSQLSVCCSKDLWDINRRVPISGFLIRLFEDPFRIKFVETTVIWRNFLWVAGLSNSFVQCWLGKRVTHTGCCSHLYGPWRGRSRGWLRITLPGSLYTYNLPPPFAFYSGFCCNVSRMLTVSVQCLLATASASPEFILSFF